MDAVGINFAEIQRSSLLEGLRCNACSELAIGAVETSCCSYLYCHSCAPKQCNRCKQYCQVRTSYLARRMLDSVPYRCPHCNYSTTLAGVEDHRVLCPKQNRPCPAPDCNFSGRQKKFIAHLLDRHQHQLLQHLDLIFPITPRAQKPASSARQVYIGDPSRRNVEVTGKHYCQRRLNGPDCACCDGYCGPNNGCNCVSCMRLDLATFENVTPRSLVNREGEVSTLSRQTNRFYCGRSNMRHDPSTDGVCGPDNGNNCHACSTLDAQSFGRYVSITAGWRQ